MSFTPINGTFVFPDTNDWEWAFGANTQVLDSSTDLLAFVLHLPANGTIDKIHYVIESVNSVNLTLRTELRTVDPTTGFPNAPGTLYGGSTSITVVNPTAGFKTAAVAATATRGDLVAIVFDFSVYTAGLVEIRLTVENLAYGNGYMFPYIVQNLTGSTVTNRGGNCYALEYNSHQYYPLEGNACTGTRSSSDSVTNSGTTRRGNRIRPPFTMRACGIVAWIDTDGDCFLRIRLVSDDSILATATLDSDVRGQTGPGVGRYFFDSGATATLTAGTDYYVLVEGNSATATTIQGMNNVPENAQLDQMNGGKNCYATAYSGSYTDTNTSLYGIMVCYDAIDTGAAVTSILMGQACL